jgi:nucleotide-binding universal stress UspA family protein
MANNPYRNILVPYDNSKFSQKALETAKTFARRFDSTLHIATVVDVSNVVSPGMIRSKEKKTIEQIRSSIKQSAKIIILQKENECAAEKIKTKGWVLEGSVTSELLRSIKENHIDLVIIGSKGLSGFSKMKALGSVSRKISEVADCPVMVIH